MNQGCIGYQMSRRAFVGAAAGTFLGLNVKSLLANAGKDGVQKAEHVILFWMGGGMSHIDTWDRRRVRADQDERERHHPAGNLP
jgi:hypothetical protein